MSTLKSIDGKKVRVMDDPKAPKVYAKRIGVKGAYTYQRLKIINAALEKYERLMHLSDDDYLVLKS